MSDQTNEPADSEEPTGFAFVTPFVQLSEAPQNLRHIFLADGLALTAAGAYGQLPTLFIRNFGVDDGEGSISRKPEYDGLTKEVVEQPEFYGDHADVTALTFGSSEQVLNIVGLLAKVVTSTISQQHPDEEIDPAAGEKVLIKYLLQSSGLDLADVVLEAMGLDLRDDDEGQLPVEAVEAAE